MIFKQQQLERDQLAILLVSFNYSQKQSKEEVVKIHHESLTQIHSVSDSKIVFRFFFFFCWVFGSGFNIFFLLSFSLLPFLLLSLSLLPSFSLHSMEQRHSFHLAHRSSRKLRKKKRELSIAMIENVLFIKKEKPFLKMVKKKKLKR